MCPVEGDRVGVEVAYALPREQIILRLDVAPGTTVRAAIEQSGILGRFSQIDLTRDPVGIFGRVATLEQAVASGDRIEIYRPLIVDPKEARRARAAKKRDR